MTMMIKFDDSLDEQKLDSTDSIDELKNELNETTKKFDEQIKLLEIRQSGILNYINDLDATNEQLKSAINSTKDGELRSKLYKALTKNIELLTKLYEVYKSYEDVKEKYLKDRSDVSLKYHRLISIDIPTLENKLGGITDSNLVDTLRALNEILQSGDSKQIDSALEDLNDDKYKI